MEFLAGYGSDADSDQPESQELASESAPPQIRPAAPVPSAAPLLGSQQTTSDVLSRLPAPSSSRTPLFSGLPAPKPAAKKVMVQFRVPITYGDAPGGDAEDEAPAPPKKRQKTSSRGLSLSEFLPPPKNLGAGARLDAGAAAGASASSGGGKKQPGRPGRGRYDSDDEELVPGLTDRTGMELGPGDPNEPEDNEAYRVDAGGPAAAQHQQQPPPQQQQLGFSRHEYYAAQQQHQQQHQAGGYDYYASYGYQQQHQSAAPAPAPPDDPAQALLAAALAEEREKALRRGGPDPLAAAGGVQFKEVSADAIRHMDPGQRASLNSVRTALGTDYEARLRTEAGPAPNRLAKRKHQIGALYAHAKAKELEDFERRAAGMKTKAETQAKYGW